MKKAWKIGTKEKKVWTAVFLSGFALGIALVCLFPDALVTGSGFLDPDSLTEMCIRDRQKSGRLSDRGMRRDRGFYGAFGTFPFFDPEG